MNQTEVNTLNDTVRSLNSQLTQLSEKYPDMRFEIVQEIGSKGNQTVKVEALQVVTTAV